MSKWRTSPSRRSVRIASLPSVDLTPEIEVEFEKMHVQMEKLMEKMRMVPESGRFLKPVDGEIVKDYYDIIKDPIDLMAIETKVIGREYGNYEEFVDDMNKLFFNCLKYYGTTHRFTKTAQRLERSFIRAWKRFFPVATNNSSRKRRELKKCVKKLGVLDAEIREQLNVRTPSARQPVTCPAATHRPCTFTMQPQPPSRVARVPAHLSVVDGSLPKGCTRTVINGKHVYVFMGGDGEKRMFRFVTEEQYQMPSAERINQVIPHIKKGVADGKFAPRNIITIRLDTSSKVPLPPAAPAVARPPLPTVAPKPPLVINRGGLHIQTTSSASSGGRPSPQLTPTSDSIKLDLTGGKLLEASMVTSRSYPVNESHMITFDKRAVFFSTQTSKTLIPKRGAQVTWENVDILKEIDDKRKAAGFHGMPGFVWNAVNSILETKKAHPSSTATQPTAPVTPSIEHRSDRTAVSKVSASIAAPNVQPIALAVPLNTIVDNILSTVVVKPIEKRPPVANDSMRATVPLSTGVASGSRVLDAINWRPLANECQLDAQPSVLKELRMGAEAMSSPITAVADVESQNARVDKHDVPTVKTETATPTNDDLNSAPPPKRVKQAERPNEQVGDGSPEIGVGTSSSLTPRPTARSDQVAENERTSANGEVELKMEPSEESSADETAANGEYNAPSLTAVIANERSEFSLRHSVEGNEHEEVSALCAVCGESNVGNHMDRHDLSGRPFKCKRGCVERWFKTKGALKGHVTKLHKDRCHGMSRRGNNTDSAPMLRRPPPFTIQNDESTLSVEQTQRDVDEVKSKSTDTVPTVGTSVVVSVSTNR